MPRPQCVILGGPNGAGKSSAAPSLLDETIGIADFVNADVIAQGLSAFDPASVALEAGRLMLRRVRKLVEARADFAIESTLSGKWTTALLNRLLGIGYDVHVLYLHPMRPEVSVARVRQRARAGGHDVPEPVIWRRYRKSLATFCNVCCHRATTWRLYQSGTIEHPPFVAEGVAGGVTRVIHGAIQEFFESACRIESRRPAVLPLYPSTRMFGKWKNPEGILRDSGALDGAMIAARHRVVLQHRSLEMPLVLLSDWRMVEVDAETVHLPGEGPGGEAAAR